MGTPARAQVCAGDCDGNNMVLINELITCVTIALGSAGVETCTACDVNGDGMVLINELISAVSRALSGCTPPPGFCGDGQMNVDGETCDDGNNLGGDGCAGNCTTEVVRRTTLDMTASVANVQFSNGFNLPLTLTGTQALTGGRPRDTAVFGPNGVQLFAPGEFPVVTKVADIKFNPITLTNLGCACVRGIEVPAFGPGIAGRGVVGCGDQGLSNVDFLVEQDHNTTPGDAGNSGSASGLPDDAECDDVFDAGDGITLNSCKEGVGAACMTDFTTHRTACWSPRHITFSGGQAPKGSVLIRNNTALALLQNNTVRACDDANVPDFGPDHKPCTDDDADMGVPNISPTTSGTASVRIFDSDNTPGATFGVGGNVDCQGCIISATGEPTDCSLLEDENAGLTGSLVTAFPGLDQQLGDAIITTTLKAEQQP
jgi:cysteine-rich repeat protein